MTGGTLRLRRRHLVGALAASALTGSARANPTLIPKSPLSLTVYDVAGALALMQHAFEDYRTANPTLVSRFVFSRAPAPAGPFSSDYTAPRANS